MGRRAALLAALAAMASAGAGLPSAAHAATPTITYTLSGTAGDNGWHRSAVTVSWAVNFNGDAVSSAGCEPAVRLTRETSGTTLSCRADNLEGSTIVQTRLIRIDLTPPTVTGAAAARPPDANGWYRAPVAVRWSAPTRCPASRTARRSPTAGPTGRRRCPARVATTPATRAPRRPSRCAMT